VSLVDEFRDQKLGPYSEFSDKGFQMSTLSFDTKTAKLLCTSDEYQIFENSLPEKLEKLTESQLRELVLRSRAVRDKWRDVDRGQRRATQADRGHRQNAENARSKDKALLFTEVHQVFVDQQTKVEKGIVDVEAGQKTTKAPKSNRRLESRATRAATRVTLQDEKRKLNQSAKKSDAKNNGSSALAKSTKTSADSIGPSNALKNSSPKSGTVKKTTKSKSVFKKPVVTKARKKALAKRAEAEASKIATPHKPLAKSDQTLTASQRDARNRPIHAKAVTNRKKVGGMTRVKAHTSSQNKRSQARRDSK
jgi:hypothetical protein